MKHLPASLNMQSRAGQLRNRCCVGSPQLEPRPGVLGPSLGLGPQAHTTSGVLQAPLLDVQWGYGQASHPCSPGAAGPEVLPGASCRVMAFAAVPGCRSKQSC